MTSKTGDSATPVTNVCTSTISMVSTNSIRDHDEDHITGVLNGGSPPSAKTPELDAPTHPAVSHVVAEDIPSNSVPRLLAEELDDKCQNTFEDTLTTEITRKGPTNHCHHYQSRNKRKNFKPRNIVYHYSDSECENDTDRDDYDFDRTTNNFCSRYSLTNCSSDCISRTNSCTDLDLSDVTAQPLDLSSDTSTSRWRLIARSPTMNSVHHISSFNPVNLSLRSNNNDENEERPEPWDQKSPAIDLSRCRSGASYLRLSDTSPKRRENEDSLQLRKIDGSHFISPPQQNLPSRTTDKPDHQQQSAEIATMKDYAENTMKELLRIYGLHDGSDIIANHLPIPNYNNGKMLDVLPASQLPSLMSVSNYPHSSCTYQIIQPPGAQLEVVNQSRISHQPRTKESPTHCIDTHWSSERSNVIPSLNQPLPHNNEGVLESLRTKMLNNMPHIATHSSNSIIPSPQVIMPQNMATIFTIAALSSKLPPPQYSSDSNSNLPTNPSSSGSPHHNYSMPTLSTVSSTTSPAVSSPNNSTVATSSSYRLDHHQKLGPVDYTRYVKRFSNAAECGSNYCKDLNYREHFHCLDCNSRVFIKKEEMIRHFKWHKKRDDSLQHGFMRYSPMDDCSDRFRNCSHNRKQTHYHCLKESCDKVYISTSDVQMHANYHRKDSAIIQEGFQRFRATENCATGSCLFFGQRTTHFHCRRSGCSFTFKNKADMEKHKTYHIKDEQLNKDGFKKFMKHEHCAFENCRFSRVCNHIHCIRPDCTYVLHSSGQLYSHKRKHERQDTELAYRKFKLAQSMMKTLSEASGLPPTFLLEPPSSGESSSSPAPGSMQLTPLPFSSQLNNLCPEENASLNDCYMLKQEKMEPQCNMPTDPASKCIPQNNCETPVPQSGSTVEDLSIVDLSAESKRLSEDLWKMYLKRYGTKDSCQSHCEYLYKDHFHCATDNCSMTFRAKDILGVKEHACNHEYQEQVTKSFYNVVEINQNNVCPSECVFKDKEKHYHCKWENCQEVISSDDNPFRRLDHYKIHKYSRKLTAPKDSSTPGTSLSSSIDSIFRRKRGRPPKNRIMEFPLGSSQLPQAMYTSFKLPKPAELPQQGFAGSLSPFTSAYNAMSLFPPPPPVTMIASPSNMPQLIPVAGLSQSIFPSTNAFQIPSPSNEKYETFSALSSLSPVQRESQEQMQQQQLPIEAEVQEGFYVFLGNLPCPDKLCAFYGQKHFHCTQPRCYYVTDRSDILLLHSKDFHDNIDILDGFVFFDRNVDCRLPGCHNNKINRHFHCIRTNCNYSFVRYSTMTIHDQKHKEQDNGNHINASSKKNVFAPVTEEENVNIHSESLVMKSPFTESSSQPKTTVVKASGTFYPLSAFTSNQTSFHTSSSQSSPTMAMQQIEKNSKDKENNRSENLQPGALLDEQPLSQLLQRSGPPSKISHQSVEKHNVYSPEENCGRPFCKLKKRDHFHCSICNQAFCGFSNLHAHVIKHSGTMSPKPTYPVGYTKNPSPLSSLGDDDDCGPADFSDAEEHSPRNGSNTLLSEENKGTIDGQHTSSTELTWKASDNSLHQSSKCSIDANPTTNNSCHLPGNDGYYGASLLDFTSLLSATDDSKKIIGLKRQFPNKLDENVDIKKMKIAALRILKDEPIPEGYTRCRFNEDCGYTHCGYREHQTHFHCMRKDCGYSFCDKTRFVQHTARHERLDTLMGGDFQQYRANVNCGRGECMYANTLGAMANKSSHFHCLKCDFVCTDTNKVVAHRRQHAKMDSIYAAGFEKYTPSQNCNVEGCNHNLKQTHYHCLKCQYAVLGLSQMSSHKYRHMEC